MKRKFLIDPHLIVCLTCFFIISIVSIYSAEQLLKGPESLYLKQLLIYGIGFATIFILLKFNISLFIDYAYLGYILGVISLVLVLFFGVEINNSRCWFVIPHLGNIQPSEFMKIALIFVLTKECQKWQQKRNKKSWQEELKLLLKVFILVLIPSVLTFLEPDTGAVFMYLIITVAILFVSGIRYRWFIGGIGILLLLIGAFLILYFLFKDFFIKILGTNFFYRIDRILNWQTGSGMQLENALMAVGSAGFLGHGLFKTPIYFPEPQTDFIFSVFSSNLGFIGAIMMVGLFLYFDLVVLNIGIKTNKKNYQFLIAGFLGMLLYQQLQNIGMTLGMLPITGITLPFISYGGSSLLSYMIMLGIIFHISYDAAKYTN